jgi:hypothetical protein
MLAATHPDRVRSVIWSNATARSTWAPNYPWGARPEYDIRELLPSVQNPTFLLTDPNDAEEARFIASRLPNASLFVHPNAGATDDFTKALDFVDQVQRFLGVDPPPAELDTVLATVLFTDIVDSTTGRRNWCSRITRSSAIA